MRGLMYYRTEQRTSAVERVVSRFETDPSAPVFRAAAIDLAVAATVWWRQRAADLLLHHGGDAGGTQILGRGVEAEAKSAFAVWSLRSFPLLRDSKQSQAMQRLRREHAA